MEMDNTKNLEKEIKINPKYDKAYYNLALALRKQGKIEEAIQNFKKFIEINPKCENAYNNLAIALKKQGKIEEAIQNYKKAI
jgi:tetratricopeptide (TPR) repeat protein